MTTSHEADSRYAWTRLGLTLALMTVGSGVMYIVSVVLPAVQAEFGVARADASLPYTLLMIGFGFGGILMGKLADANTLLTDWICVKILSNPVVSVLTSLAPTYKPPPNLAMPLMKLG